MKSEVILDAIGKADDKYIEEAAPKEKKVKKFRWMKWGTIAACLALAVYVGIRLIPTETSEPNTSAGTKNLPMLTITPETDSMGCEACYAYDISELDDGNPWTMNTKLDTMPVYKNISYNTTGIAIPGIGKENMLKRAEQAADALNMEITDVKYEMVDDIITNDSSIDNNTIYSVNAATDTAIITVTGDGMVTVSFNDGIELPKEYSFTYTNPSDEEANRVTDYLIKKFSKFLSFNNPQKALFADYTFDGSRNRDYYVYDSDGNITKQILNYNFNKVAFAPDDNGNLMQICKYNDLSCAEKIGDYPIITSEDALKLLVNGNYITSVPEEIPGEKYIVKTELVYRTAISDETFLPYYLFWIELPDMQQENGLKTYGAYYVPAVQQQYISNMPLWDGICN